jgi:hypothetical protein
MSNEVIIYNNILTGFSMQEELLYEDEQDADNRFVAAGFRDFLAYSLHSGQCLLK